MELIKVIAERRSVRKFKADPISDDQVKKILEAGVMAPAAGNVQCWRFYVVKNEEMRKNLATRSGHQEFIGVPPVIIVVVADLDEIGQSYGERGRGTYALQDTAAAIENMLLTVTDLGLASCWIGAFDELAAAKFLGLPGNMRPVAMLPIGHSDGKPKSPPKKSLNEVVSYV